MLTHSTSRTASLLLCLLVLLTLSAGHALADDEGLGCIKAGRQDYLVAPYTRRHPRRGRTSRARELRRGSKPFLPRCRAGEAYRRGLPNSRHCSRGGFDKSLLPLHRHRYACVWTPVHYLRPPGTVSEGQAKLNQERVVQEILKHRDFSNLVMVTHDLNISDVVLEDTVPMGEFFVVQPRGRRSTSSVEFGLND